MSHREVDQQPLVVHSSLRDEGESIAFLYTQDQAIENVVRLELSATSIPLGANNVGEGNDHLFLIVTWSLESESAGTQSTSGMSCLPVAVPRGNYTKAGLAVALEASINDAIDDNVTEEYINANLVALQVTGPIAISVSPFTVGYNATTDRYSIQCAQAFTVLPRLSTAQLLALEAFFHAQYGSVGYNPPGDGSWEWLAFSLFLRDFSTLGVGGLSSVFASPVQDGLEGFLETSLHEAVGLELSYSGAYVDPKLFVAGYVSMYILPTAVQGLDAYSPTQQQALLANETPVAIVPYTERYTEFGRSEPTYYNSLDFSPPITLPAQFTIVLGDPTNGGFAKLYDFEHRSVFRVTKLFQEGVEPAIVATNVTNFPDTVTQYVVVHSDQASIVHATASDITVPLTLLNVTAIEGVSFEIPEVPNVVEDRSDRMLVLHNFSWTPDGQSAIYGVNAKVLSVQVVQGRYTASALAAAFASLLSLAQNDTNYVFTFDSRGVCTLGNEHDIPFTVVPRLDLATAQSLFSAMPASMQSTFTVAQIEQESNATAHATLGFSHYRYHRSLDNSTTDPIGASTPSDAYIPHMDRTAATLHRVVGVRFPNVDPETYVELAVDLGAGFEVLARISVAPDDTYARESIAYPNRLSLSRVTASEVRFQWRLVDGTPIAFASAWSGVLRVDGVYVPSDPNEIDKC